MVCHSALIPQVPHHSDAELPFGKPGTSLFRIVPDAIVLSIHSPPHVC